MKIENTWGSRCICVSSPVIVVTAATPVGVVAIVVAVVAAIVVVEHVVVMLTYVDSDVDCLLSHGRLCT